MNENDIKIVENAKEIEKINERFSLMMERLEEKMDDLNKNMNTGFSDLHKKISGLEEKFDAVDKKVDNIEKELPTKVEKIVAYEFVSHKKDGYYKFANWIKFSLVGSCVIVVAGKLVWEFISKTIGC
jgi:predicted  nucleic acid-binding Zn-ribbon protein